MAIKRIDVSKDISLITGGESDLYLIEDGNISRSFYGIYTVKEVEAILSDMKYVEFIQTQTKKINENISNQKESL